MAFCGQCGAPLPEEARFCARCGAPAPVSAPAAGETPAPVENTVSEPAADVVFVPAAGETPAPVENTVAEPAADVVFVPAAGETPAPVENTVSEPAADVVFVPAAGETPVPVEDTVPEPPVCPHCGTPVIPGGAFCAVCGTALPTAAPVAPATDGVPAPKKAKSHKKLWLFGGLGLAVIALGLVAVLVVMPLLGAMGGERPGFVLYLQNDELTLQTVGGRPVVLTDGLNSAVDADRMGWYGCVADPEGRWLLYPDSYAADGFTLCKRDLRRPEQAGQALSDGVKRYQVSEDAARINLLRGDPEELVTVDIASGRSELLAKEVASFSTSRDGKTLLWRQQNGDVWLRFDGELARHLNAGTESAVCLSPEGRAAAFVTDGVLYRVMAGGEPEVLLSQVETVIWVHDNGDVLYAVAADPVNPLDCVDDPNAEADAALEPPVFPTVAQLSPEEAARLLQQYDEDQQAYEQKEARDALRQTLAGQQGIDLYVLGRYSDGRGREISDVCAMLLYADSANDILAYYELDAAAVDRVTLTGAEGEEHTLLQQIYQNLLEALQPCVAVEGTATRMELDSMTNFVVAPDGSACYVIVPDDGSPVSGGAAAKGTLYRMTVTDGVLGQPQRLDVGSTVGVAAANDDRILYFHGAESDPTDLVIGGQTVGSNVYLGHLFYTGVWQRTDTIAYLTDWDEQAETGTLWVYEQGETRQIDSNVARFAVLPDGSVAYLFDPAGTRMVRLYRQGETQTLTDGGQDLVPYLCPDDVARQETYTAQD